jgi:methoxymalonate biosynthesis acyl carrier protein
MDDRLSAIKAFVAKHLGGIEVADDEDFFASGHVNSLFAVQIVMFVENTLGVPVIDDDLDIANFSTVDRIHRFVDAKAPAAVAAAGH